MTKVLGVDISEHNGNVDFSKMKAAGVRFAMLRASWGHFNEDAKIRDNVKKCKKAGMPYGLYHYSYADTDANAKTEAQKFMALCRELGGYTYPLSLDMEDADGWKKENGVDDAQNLRTIQIFKDILEGAGAYMSLYMSKSWFDRLRPLNAKLIDSIDAWLAHWGVSEPSMPCGMWQYTSDGVVAGSSARTDMNYAYIDYPSVIAGLKNKTDEADDKTPSGSVMDLATAVMQGQYGNGEARKKALGSKYDAVQEEVNHRLSASVEALAKEVKAGRYGNGEARKKALGSRYEEVQAAVNNEAAAKTLKVGMKAKPKKAVSYDGVRLLDSVTKKSYTVTEIKGDRVVLGDGLNTAFQLSNLSY